MYEDSQYCRKPSKSDHFWKWAIILWIIGLQGYCPIIMMFVVQFLWKDPLSIFLWLGGIIYAVLTTGIIWIVSRMWDNLS